MKRPSSVKKAPFSGLFPGRKPTVRDTAAPKASPWEALWQALILLMGTAGCLGCLITSFKLTVHPVAFYIVLPLLAVLFTLVYRARLYGIYIFLLLLGAALLIFLAFPLFQNAFLVTLAQALDRLNEHLNWHLFTLPCTCPVSQHTTISTLLLLLVSYLIFMLLGWSVIQRKNLPLTILFMLPFLASGLYFTLAPGTVPAILVVLCWMGVLSMQMEKHGRRLFSESGALSVKAGAVVLAVTMLCVAVVSIFIPSAGFRQPSVFENAHSALLEHNFVNFLKPDTVASGGLSEGKIDGADVIRFSGETAMTLTTNSERPFYLRGWVGGAYNGRGWEAPSDSLLPGFSDELDQLMREGFREQTQISTYLENAVYPDQQGGETLFWKDTFPSYSVGISLVNANSLYAYIPTGLDSAQGNLSYDSTGIVYPIPWGNREYTMDMVTPLNEDFLYDCNSMGIDHLVSQLPDRDSANQYQTNEARYRSLIHEAYTNLPEQVKEDCLLYLENSTPEFSYFALPPEEMTPADLINRIKLVRDCLRQSARYTLSPGATPEGKDFVNYFLTENHKGYCVHFATSGAVLLRALGVPARYAEGYAVTWDDLAEAKEKGAANITDANAHAWVEVYLDGFGWLPVEFTPGFTDLQSLPHEDEDSSANLAATASEPESSSPSSSSSLPVSQSEDVPTVSLPDSPAADAFPASSPTPLPPSAWAGMIGGILLLLAALVLCLRRKSALAKRREEISSHAPRCVSSCYLYLKHLAAFDGQPDKGYSNLKYAEALDRRYGFSKEDGFLRAAKLMEQAEFSLHPVSEEERRWMSGFAKSFAKRIYENASIWKKWILKYIHNLS